MDLPPLFLDRLARIVPEDRLDGVLASFSAPLWTGFRINPLRALSGDGPPAVPANAMELPWLPGAWVVPPASRQELLESLAFGQGHIWVQNPSSMIPPVVLDPVPTDRVLDLAAAPGSKTLQLAGMMGHGADIAAVEVVKPRFYRLKRNLRAQGASHVKTFNRDGTTVWRHRPDHFDRVLLDAPCSTEGGFRSGEPQTYSHWSPRKIKTMAGKQRLLLESAVRSTRPGGVIVYSTCSLAPEENEAVIQHALEQFPGELEVEPVSLQVPGRVPALAGWDQVPFEPAISRAMRVLPDGIYEAFFVCRMRRAA